MKVYTDFQQGSVEWYRARLGIPTASNFDKIITPAKGDLSKQARGYAYYLAAETLLGQTLENLDHVEWIARGKEMEPQAVAAYQLMHDIAPDAIRQVGFITNDDGTYGCSPDRLLADGGGLEVKCPAPQTHLGYMIDGPPDAYKPQVQGQLWIAELDFVDFFSFHPAMPPAVVRIRRDEPYIRKLAAALDEFTELRLSVLARARANGFFATHDRVTTPAQQRLQEWTNRECDPTETG